MVHDVDNPDNYKTRNLHTKKKVFSLKFWREIANTRTSGVRGGACKEPVIRRARARGEISTLPIQRVGLTPDVHASSAHRECRCGLESIIKVSSQAMAWPLLMACSATAEAEELALLKACLCSLRRRGNVLPVCPA